MIVGFDLQPLVRGAGGGINQWLGGVVRAYVTAYPEDRVLLFEPDDFSFDWARFSSVERLRGARHSLHRLEHEVLRSRPIDVLVRSYPAIHDPGFPPARQIVVIPDIQHADHPGFFSPTVLRVRRLAFGGILSEVGAVATMTEFSRESILRYPWTACRDVFLMPPAVDLDLVAATDEGSEPDVAEAAIAAFSGYFFMPANPWPHKNHRRLFEAFALARPRLPAGTGLVLTGAGDDWAQILSGFEDLPIRHLGYLPRASVARLYRRALALVFFSLYEGFGMPLLEAFHFGAPVLCSDIPALTEVGKNAVLSCSPEDVPAMAENMVRIAADAGARRGLVERGRERLRDFGWKSSAEALHAAVRRVDARARGSLPIVATGRFDGRISVIIDASHRGPVDAAVEAVVRQSHQDWELLVVSSSRRRPRHLPEDSRIRRLVDTDSNAALRGTKALASASGDVRMYLRPDCILDEHALARIAARFRENPACDLVAGATVGADPLGKIVARWSMPPVSPARALEDPWSLPTFQFESSLLACIGGDFRGMRPVVAWRRRIADLEPGLDPSLASGFDAEYWLRLSDAGAAIAAVEERLATIRVTADAGSARYWYRVMRDCKAIAERRKLKIDERFFGFLHHRRLGLEPWAAPAPRWLPSLLGRRDHRIYSAQQQPATFAHQGALRD